MWVLSNDVKLETGRGARAAQAADNCRTEWVVSRTGRGRDSRKPCRVERGAPALPRAPRTTGPMHCQELTVRSSKARF